MSDGRFKPGWEGGPGRPKDPPELSLVKQMTKGEFTLLIHKLINLSYEELAAFRGTVLEMAMASAMQKAIKSGDIGCIQTFIDRLFGKVKEEHKVEGNPFQIIVKDYMKKE